jgi:hypothetical protein
MMLQLRNVKDHLDASLKFEPLDNARDEREAEGAA